MSCKTNYKNQIVEKVFREASPQQSFKRVLDITPENKDSFLKKYNITYTNEEGKPCFKNGFTESISGTDWKIIKDFKGLPKHSQGGIDISLSNKGVEMRIKGKKIKAKNGFVILNT